MYQMITDVPFDIFLCIVKYINLVDLKRLSVTNTVLRSFCKISTKEPLKNTLRKYLINDRFPWIKPPDDFYYSRYGQPQQALMKLCIEDSRFCPKKVFTCGNYFESLDLNDLIYPKSFVKLELDDGKYHAPRHCDLIENFVIHGTNITQVLVYNHTHLLYKGHFCNAGIIRVVPLKSGLNTMRYSYYDVKIIAAEVHNVYVSGLHLGNDDRRRLCNFKWQDGTTVPCDFIKDGMYYNSLLDDYTHINT